MTPPDEVDGLSIPADEAELEVGGDFPESDWGDPLDGE